MKNQYYEKVNNNCRCERLFWRFEGHKLHQGKKINPVNVRSKGLGNTSLCELSVFQPLGHGPLVDCEIMSGVP